MRISTTLLAMAAGLTPAFCLTINTDSQAKLSPSVGGNDDNKIPGDSPLELCPGDHTSDMIEIQRVDLLPNPPEAGNNLTISAMGVVKETICEGAYVNLQVKYGLIKLISTQADLCEQIRNVDMECPVEAGLVNLKKVVELPAEIPPGRYTVSADVYTKDDKPVTCLTATIVFGIPHAVGGFFDPEL